MRYTPLPNNLPAASVLGLGCAPMLGSASRRQSLAALHAALDAGINLFDTARSYGFGAGESLLGDFFAANPTQRDRIVLCTKFGILPTPPTWKHRLKPLARTALQLVPSLRAAARTHAPAPTLNQFSVAALRASLEASLRALRTTYVDILLLHAAPIAVLQQADLFAELETLVAQGKVRLAGISAEPGVIAATLAHRPPILQTAQFAVNLQTLPFLNRISSELATQPKLFLVANQPFAGPLGLPETRRRIAALHTNPTLPPNLRAKLDPADPQLLPELLLNLILNQTGIDAVLSAMLNPAHLHANCRAIAHHRFTPADLTHLRQLLTH